MANLEKLREAGKIRYIGVSNFSGEQHREAAQYGLIHSSQPCYNMLHREPEAEILPACLDLGIGVIPHSPLAKGMLTGKYRPGHVFPTDDERGEKREFQDDEFNATMPIIEKLLEWAGDHGREGSHLAIAWTLAQPAVTSCIVGAKTPNQALDNAAAGEWVLSQSDLDEISGIFCSC